MLWCLGHARNGVEPQRRAGNEGRLREYNAWGVEPRLSMHHRALGVASETEFGVRAHFENQDRLQQNGDTSTARTGVVVESNVRTNAAYAGFVQNRFLFGGWTVTPRIRMEHVRYERSNRLANAGAGVTGETDLTRLIPGVGVSRTTGERVTLFRVSIVASPRRAPKTSSRTPVASSTSIPS